MTEAGRLRLAIDLDGVLTEHPRPLAQAASARFGVEMPESAFVDSAGLNVPDQVRDWVYSPDGPAARLQPDPRAAEFLRLITALWRDQPHARGLVAHDPPHPIARLGHDLMEHRVRG